MAIDIKDLTIREIEQIQALLQTRQSTQAPEANPPNPMLGRRCVVRTYSAGVHAGSVLLVDGTSVHLTDSIRIWKWENGGLALGDIANEGMKGGKTERTVEIYLTDANEIIPCTQKAWDSYEKYLQK